MDTTLLLIVAIISVAIGYAGGALITASRAGKKAPLEAESSNEATEPEIKLAHQEPAPTQAPPPAVMEPVDPNRVEIAKLWRELPQGALRADMSGSTIKTAWDLSLEQRNTLRTLQQDLEDWLGPVSVAAQPAVTGAQMPATATPTPGPVIETPAKLVIAEANAMPGEESAQPVSADQPVERKNPQSIVGQIDEILQSQLKGTPLESRGVRLVESATHGVTVWIGLKAYQGMDAIPDAEVNTAIRRAVKEWEARK